MLTKIKDELYINFEKITHVARNEEGLSIFYDMCKITLIDDVEDIFIKKLDEYLESKK